MASIPQGYYAISGKNASGLVNVECDNILVTGEVITSKLPSLKFSTKSNQICEGRKTPALPANATTVISSYTGGPGIINRIWLATYNAPPGTTSIIVTCDGVIVGGNTNSGYANGLNNTPLNLDVFFGAGGGQNDPFQVGILGTNNFSATSIGGYLAMDMPFNNSFSVALFNQSATEGNYWSQVFYNALPSIPASLSTLKLYMTTFRYQATAAGTEYPLLYTQSPNGVFLKGVKMYIAGTSGNWWESRFRMYAGGTTGSTAPVTSTGYSDGAAAQKSSNYVNGAVPFFMSSGTEDFFLSSWNWAGTTRAMSTNSSGTIYNSAGDGVTVGSTNTVSCYRFFGEDGTNALPSAQPNTNFIFTWSCGDSLAGSSGVVFLLGQVYYYA